MTRGDPLVEQEGNDEVPPGSIIFPFDDVPTVKIQLPESIYSSAMLSIHGAHASDFEGMQNAVISLMIVFPQVVLLVINIVIQLSFVQYLQRTLSGIESCEIKTDLVLRYLSVAAFVAGMVFEFFECFEMVLWTWYVKTENSHQALQLQVQADGSKQQVSGLTVLQKFVFVVVVVGTKTATAVYLFTVGAQFVLMSETHSDLILNCLAMLFVVEIDDILYHGFTPAFCKEVISGLPPLEVNSFNQGVVRLVLLPWIKIAFWFIATHLIVTYDNCQPHAEL
eukprot:Skav202197  [mRNA]  locus=scaffold191:99132:99971:- [translate_table: standard]